MKKIKFNKNNINDFSSINYSSYAKKLDRKRNNHIGKKPFAKKIAKSDIYTILGEALFPEQFQEMVHEYLKEDYPELFLTREEIKLNIAINLWKKKISYRGWNTRGFETIDGLAINEIDKILIIPSAKKQLGDAIWFDEVLPYNENEELFNDLRNGDSKYYIENFDDDKNKNRYYFDTDCDNYLYPELKEKKDDE